jgi:hypothetical protein
VGFIMRYDKRRLLEFSFSFVLALRRLNRSECLKPHALRGGGGGVVVMKLCIRIIINLIKKLIKFKN